MNPEPISERTHRWQDWDLESLLRRKQESGLRTSLVLPARNEAATIGDVVGRVRTALVEAAALLDEIVVIDSDSTDETFDAATDAGAVVHRSREIRPDLGTHPGKGEAMWKSLFVTRGDLIVFMDADLVDWDTHFVRGLLGPLLFDDGVALVKGFYERTQGDDAGGGASLEGGRVTELVARPLIALEWPELSWLVHPLAGEWAVRRDLFQRLSVPTGYAVELAALVDTLRLLGPDAIAQVDLGRRAHRHQGAARTGQHGRADPRRLQPTVHWLGTGPCLARAAAQGGRGDRDRPERDPARRASARHRPDGPGGRIRGMTLRLGRQSFADDRRLIMAIVNRTPDSFYDKGATWSEDKAFDRVAQVVDEGAEIIDIGGIKAAPGEEIDAEEEMRRTVGFVERVRGVHPDVVISVDTWRAQVARAVCEAGADVINDAWGGADPELVDVAAKYDAGIICTHTGGVVPRTRPHRIEYADVVASAVADTTAYAERALAAGVDRESIVIDPAHDFGKTTQDSLDLTRRLDELVATGWPVLVSLSNKDFVGEALDLPVGERLIGTLAATAVCATHGARIFRVHEVTETRQVVDMVDVILGRRPPARDDSGVRA